MKKILVVNLNFAVDKTAIVDKLAKGCVYRLSRVKTMPGGKGVNVARALETLGNRTELIGFTAGFNGQWISQALQNESLAASCVNFSPGESRICYSIADISDGASTDFNEEGPKVPLKAQKELIRVFRDKVRHFDAVAFCGRIANGLRPDFFQVLIKIAKRAGKLTALDTSGAPLKEAVKAGPTLIKINRQEIEEATGRRFGVRSLRKFFKNMRALGTEYVVVTDGPNPTYAVTPDNLWRFLPPSIKVVTPIGAGDSFMAGLLYGFSTGLPRQECVKLALGAAASDCLSLGAGIINKRQCLNFSQKARLERLGPSVK